MSETRFVELNNIANKYGYDIEGAAWCEGCYDIYKMDSTRPEIADCLPEEVEKFVAGLEK